jgi:hypothetical protein
MPLEAWPISMEEYALAGLPLEYTYSTPEFHHQR